MNAANGDVRGGFSSGLTNYGLIQLGSTNVLSTGAGSPMYRSTLEIGAHSAVVSSGQPQTTVATLTNYGTIDFLKGAGDLKEKRIAGVLDNKVGGVLAVEAGTGLAILGHSTFVGAHTNSGTITLGDGSKLFLASGNSLTNNANGTLQGKGTLNLNTGATFTNKGTLKPGIDEVGSLGVAVVAMESTSHLAIDILGNTADRLNIATGSLLAGSLDVKVLTAPSNTDSFTILSSDGGAGTYSGTFSNVSQVGGIFKVATLDNSATFDVTYGANTVVLSNYAAVPEPSTIALALSVTVMGLSRRSRKHA